MIAHISPASTAFEESRSTLAYAQRAKSIRSTVGQAQAPSSPGSQPSAGPLSKQPWPCCPVTGRVEEFIPVLLHGCPEWGNCSGHGSADCEMLRTCPIAMRCLGTLWGHSHALPGDLAWGSWSGMYLGTCSTSSVLLGDPL